MFFMCLLFFEWIYLYVRAAKQKRKSDLVCQVKIKLQKKYFTDLNQTEVLHLFMS